MVLWLSINYSQLHFRKVEHGLYLLDFCGTESTAVIQISCWPPCLFRSTALPPRSLMSYNSLLNSVVLNLSTSVSMSLIGSELALYVSLTLLTGLGRTERRRSKTKFITCPVNLCQTRHDLVPLPGVSTNSWSQITTFKVKVFRFECLNNFMPNWC